jgi:hypothetical protein
MNLLENPELTNGRRYSSAAFLEISAFHFGASVAAALFANPRARSPRQQAIEFILKSVGDLVAALSGGKKVPSHAKNTQCANAGSPIVESAAEPLSAPATKSALAAAISAGRNTRLHRYGDPVIKRSNNIRSRYEL